MERIYNVEDAKERLTKRLAYYSERVEAWQKVERVHKKDGEDFANLAKNFTNADIKKSWTGDEFTVHFHSKYEGYTTDYITLTGNAYGGEDIDTADKVAEKIAEKIAKYNGYIESTKAGLETVEAQFEAIKPELEALKQAIANAHEVDCHYLMGSYIKEYLHII